MLILPGRFAHWTVALFGLLTWYGSTAAEMILAVDHLPGFNSAPDLSFQSSDVHASAVVQRELTACPTNSNELPLRPSSFRGVALSGQADETGVGSRSPNSNQRTSFPYAQIVSAFQLASPALVAQLNRDAWEHIPTVPPFELLRPPQVLATQLCVD